MTTTLCHRTKAMLNVLTYSQDRSIEASALTAATSPRTSSRPWLPTSSCTPGHCSPCSYCNSNRYCTARSSRRSWYSTMLLPGCTNTTVSRTPHQDGQSRKLTLFQHQPSVIPGKKQPKFWPSFAQPLVEGSSNKLCAIVMEISRGRWPFSLTSSGWDSGSAAAATRCEV
jgi:hypothetical protein